MSYLIELQEELLDLAKRIRKEVVATQEPLTNHMMAELFRSLANLESTASRLEDAAILRGDITLDDASALNGEGE